MQPKGKPKLLAKVARFQRDSDWGLQTAHLQFSESAPRRALQALDSNPFPQDTCFQVLKKCLKCVRD
jgi:hypothetical protein